MRVHVMTRKTNGKEEVIRISDISTDFFIDGQYVRSGKGDLILKQCDESLRNLKTDYIDLMIVHWPDPVVPYEETVGALTRRKEEGAIRHIGVSNFNLEQLQRAMQVADVEGGSLCNRTVD